MSKHTAGFDFAQWVPGFDFLQQAAQAHAVAQPQMHPQGQRQGPQAAQRPGGSPAWAQWLAPTLDPQEAARRIQELKTVLFWLEQNATALKATIQALEVQQLTCQTLKDMQAHWMEQVASASESGGAQAQAQAPAPAPAPESVAAQTASHASGDAHPSAGASYAEANGDAQLGASAAPSASTWQGAAAQAGQWWGSLLHTFGQIAQQAQQEVAQRQAVFTHAQAQATTATAAPEADAPSVAAAANTTVARATRRAQSGAALNRATQTPRAASSKRSIQPATSAVAKSAPCTKRATNQPAQQQVPSAAARASKTRVKEPQGAKKRGVS